MLARLAALKGLIKVAVIIKQSRDSLGVGLVAVARLLTARWRRWNRGGVGSGVDVMVSNTFLLACLAALEGLIDAPVIMQ